VSNAQNATSIDPTIKDEISAKEYLNKLKLIYEKKEDKNERLTVILNLSNKVKKYMSIGKNIEGLSKNI
jgi:hypothetical protein